MSGHACPECGRSDDSLSQLKVHYRTAHGGHLPRWVCDTCGERFHATFRRKFCSDACRAVAGPRGAKETSTCECCGEDFEYYPKKTAGKYCSRCYASGEAETTTALSGSDNPRWSGGKQRCECDVCGRWIERYPCNIGETVVCSESCRRRWLSDEFTGEGHPNWEGGETGPYGPGWHRVRQQALERDGNQCVNCGRDTEDIGRNPDVHHIVPVRWFVDSEHHSREDAHFLSNVVALCPSCHRKADFGHLSREYLRSLQDGRANPET